MRTENSIKNSIVAVFSNVVVMILGFVLQTVFVKTLGDEYLGINGLFANIVSMLAIVELGIGPAIVSNLYKPLAENDKERVKSLLLYYKKCYIAIGVLVLIIGIGIMPFLKLFVKTKIELDNWGGIYFIFFLFILDAVFSYFCSYKRSIIQADQQNRIINITHLICYTFMICLQTVILLTTKNYVLFLIIKIFLRLLENLILSAIANKKYVYLKEPAIAIQKTEKKDILTKVKGLIYHKIGSYIVLGTDNIIISTFLGVGLVGIYSNYYLIINSLYTLYCQIFSSLTASVGNLLISENKETSYDIYKKIMFINFWIYGFSSVALYCMMTPFMTLWFGSNYILSDKVLIVLIVNFYMLGMRSSIGSFKEAAGIFFEDRFIPIIESAINIVSSLILVHFFGMFGVFVGTFLSSTIVVFYSLPHFVFKKVFNQPKIEYYKLYFKYAIITAISIIITGGLCRLTTVIFSMSTLTYLIVATLFSALIPNLFYMICFKNTSELMYFKNFILSQFRKVRSKI